MQEFIVNSEQHTGVVGPLDHTKSCPENRGVRRLKNLEPNGGVTIWGQEQETTQNKLKESKINPSIHPLVNPRRQRGDTRMQSEICRAGQSKKRYRRQRKKKNSASDSSNRSEQETNKERTNSSRKRYGFFSYQELPAPRESLRWKKKALLSHTLSHCHSALGERRKGSHCGRKGA
uniref:Uncharacterized protein n=1 Tax=Oryza brachyantha TaxID=4533 RepID=J3NDY4_ORYBR